MPQDEIFCQLIYARCLNHYNFAWNKTKKDNFFISPWIGYGWYNYSPGLTAEQNCLDAVNSLEKGFISIFKNAWCINSSYVYLPVNGLPVIARIFSKTHENRLEHNNVHFLMGRMSDNVYPCQFLIGENHPFWGCPPEEEYYEKTENRPLLPDIKISRDMLASCGIDVSPIFNSGHKKALFKKALCFLIEQFDKRRQRDNPQTLVIRATPHNTAMWITAFSKYMPAAVAQKLSFSTNVSFGTPSEFKQRLVNSKDGNMPYFMIAGTDPDDRDCTNIPSGGSFHVLLDPDKNFDYNSELLSSPFFNDIFDNPQKIETFIKEYWSTLPENHSTAQAIQRYENFFAINNLENASYQRLSQIYSEPENYPAQKEILKQKTAVIMKNEVLFKLDMYADFKLFNAMIALNPCEENKKIFRDSLNRLLADYILEANYSHLKYIVLENKGLDDYRSFLADSFSFGIMVTRLVDQKKIVVPALLIQDLKCGMPLFSLQKFEEQMPALLESLLDFYIYGKYLSDADNADGIEKLLTNACLEEHKAVLYKLFIEKITDNENLCMAIPEKLRLFCFTEYARFKGSYGDIDSEKMKKYLIMLPDRLDIPEFAVYAHDIEKADKSMSDIIDGLRKQRLEKLLNEKNYQHENIFLLIKDSFAAQNFLFGEYCLDDFFTDENSKYLIIFHEYAKNLKYASGKIAELSELAAKNFLFLLNIFQGNPYFYLKTLNDFKELINIPQEAANKFSAKDIIPHTDAYSVFLEFNPAAEKEFCERLALNPVPEHLAAYSAIKKGKLSVLEDAFHSKYLQEFNEYADEAFSVIFPMENIKKGISGIERLFLFAHCNYQETNPYFTLSIQYSDPETLKKLNEGIKTEPDKALLSPAVWLRHNKNKVALAKYRAWQKLRKEINALAAAISQSDMPVSDKTELSDMLEVVLPHGIYRYEKGNILIAALHKFLNTKIFTGYVFLAMLIAFIAFYNGSKKADNPIQKKSEICAEIVPSVLKQHAKKQPVKQNYDVSVKTSENLKEIAAVNAVLNNEVIYDTEKLNRKLKILNKIEQPLGKQEKQELNYLKHKIKTDIRRIKKEKTNSSKINFSNNKEE